MCAFNNSLIPDLGISDDSRNLHPSFLLNESERGRMESLHHCVARIKQLTYKPIIIDINTNRLRPMLKSASDPCNLDRLTDQDSAFDSNDHCHAITKDNNTSLSCTNIAEDLRKRLSIRKKLIYSAKLKFLGLQAGDLDPVSGVKEPKDKSSTSPICALISEIRETINEIVSPERSKKMENSIDDYFDTLRWIKRPKFVPKIRKTESERTINFERSANEKHVSQSLYGGSKSCETVSLESLNEFREDFKIIEKSDAEDSEELSEEFNLDQRDNANEKTYEITSVDSNENGNKDDVVRNVLTELVQMIQVSDEEATYTVTDDSLLPTYSFTETTETDWYYEKTIMKLENSQTVLEIKDAENKDAYNRDAPTIRNVDTGIDTDFTSEKENEIKEGSALENPALEKQLNVTEEVETEAILCENSAANKSSETDSSFLKSSSGQTSNDVDTSFAFKTETESSEKTNGKSKCHDSLSQNQIIKDSTEVLDDSKPENSEFLEKQSNEENYAQKLPGIPESPEFMNVDTEDAPVTSSSKDTSPEIVNAEQFTEDEPVTYHEEKFVENISLKNEKEEPDFKPVKKKKKRNKKSSTKITVKKALKESNSKEPVVSEIKLTIKNSKQCQSEKYEVKIQDTTNTSEEFSSSLGENMESFEIDDFSEKNCDCDAQQNLEELQGEVSSTIEKLQTIEDYFENEIKKHSVEEVNDKTGGELTIEYNYGEFEDVMNESRGIERVFIKNSEEEKNATETTEEAPECFTSSILNNIRERVWICDDLDVVGSQRPDLPFISTARNDLESGLDTKNLEEALPQHLDINLKEEENATEVRILDTAGAQFVTDRPEEGCTKICEADAISNEISCSENVEDFFVDLIEKLSYNVIDQFEKCSQGEGSTENFSQCSVTSSSKFEMIKDEEIIAIRDIDGAKVNVHDEAQKKNAGEELVTSLVSDTQEKDLKVNDEVANFQVELKDAAADRLQFLQYLNWFLRWYFSPLKALTWSDHNVLKLPKHILGISNFPVQHLRNQIVMSTTKEKLEPPVNEVTNFILGSELSPTNSLIEFEDMENLISTSISVVAGIIDSIEYELEAEMGCLPEQTGGRENEWKDVVSSKRGKDGMFKVVVATPTRKEIFINYSINSTSSFDLSNDFEFCNSYINTDDVNEDFENFSSDNSAFFSMESPVKNSPNSSYGSIESTLNGHSGKNQFCCVQCEEVIAKGSPRSLSIIPEVDEGGESSTSSEVCSAPIVNSDK